jgi:hypothetical protein
MKKDEKYCAGDIVDKSLSFLLLLKTFTNLRPRIASSRSIHPMRKHSYFATSDESHYKSTVSHGPHDFQKTSLFSLMIYPWPQALERSRSYILVLDIWFPIRQFGSQGLIDKFAVNIPPWRLFVTRRHELNL